MNSDIKPVNRNTGKLIAKNIIILTVLITVCSLSIWAWFTQNKTALADGVYVKSKGEGVQVSWDGVNYYDNLQALKQEDISGDANGLALNISGKDGEPAPLSLVTGNGLQFFEPSLNRRLGTVLTNPDGSWHGTDITSENSQGKYIDIDLYFRSESARSVFLAGDSKISPKSITNRISEYGVFSKDNIASASRLAFLNEDKDECAFIWAPNADNELVQNDAGYKKYTTTDTEGGGSTSGSLDDVIDFVEDIHGDYYLWLPTDYSDDPHTQDSSLVANKMKFTVYDRENNTGLYTCEYTITEPDTGKNPTIIYYINKSASIWNSNDISYVDVSKSNANNDASDSYPKVALATDFNLSNTSTQTDRKAPGFYVEGFKTQEITITIGYNPVSREVVVIGYSSTGAQTKTYNRAGETLDSVIYYPLENDITCALVNPLSSSAVSQGNNFHKSISFIDSEKENVSPVSITLEEQFTTIKDGTGSAATYKFKSNNNNTYLTLTNGSVSFAATGSRFSLEYKDEVEGPLLKSGDYYLVIDQGKLKGVKADVLNTVTAVTVYTGTTYEFNTGLTQDKQLYQFYNSKTKLLETLSSATSPKLFTSTNSDAEDTRVCSTPVTTLTKSAGSDYYTSHIVMRVWVEGTDREAKTPLADGIFDISLHFTSQ